MTCPRQEASIDQRLSRVSAPLVASNRAAGIIPHAALSFALYGHPKQSYESALPHLVFGSSGCKSTRRRLGTDQLPPGDAASMAHPAALSDAPVSDAKMYVTIRVYPIADAARAAAPYRAEQPFRTPSVQSRVTSAV